MSSRVIKIVVTLTCLDDEGKESQSSTILESGDQLVVDMKVNDPTQILYEHPTDPNYATGVRRIGPRTIELYAADSSQIGEKVMGVYVYPQTVKSP